MINPAVIILQLGLNKSERKKNFFCLLMRFIYTAIVLCNVVGVFCMSGFSFVYWKRFRVMNGNFWKWVVILIKTCFLWFYFILFEKWFRIWVMCIRVFKIGLCNQKLNVRMGSRTILILIGGKWLSCFKRFYNNCFDVCSGVI